MKVKLMMVLTFLPLLGACTMYSVTSEDTTMNYYPSKKSAADVVYVDQTKQAHEVIATVIVNAERNQKINDVIEKMKYEAAILGGDAITDIRTDATGIWKRLPAQKLVANGYVRANFSAKVIVFR